MTEPWWRRADTAAGGLAVDLALYAGSAAFAALTAATSTLVPHRAWGAIAMIGYAVAAVAVLAQLLLRATAPALRAAVCGLAVLGTVVAPLIVQAVQRAAGRTDRAQEEVLVIEQAGARLLDTGTPYLTRAAIAALPDGFAQLLGYVPYQPGMAAFGLPRAALGDPWYTDARLWFAAVTAAALLLAVRTLRRPPRVTSAAAVVRAVQFATVLPVCALTLVTGGDDLPVLALCLLALACCARRRYAAAGVAVGVAAALKLLAWPILLVLLIHVYAATRPARRPLAGFAATALGVPILTLVPALLVSPGATVENVVRFPLGHGLVTSPAASPFPGYLIAGSVPGGRTVATVLLVAAGLAVAWWMWRRPPRTAAAAGVVCAVGLLAAILLMPATRFGYLLYPLALLAWYPALAEDGGPSPGRSARSAAVRAPRPVGPTGIPDEPR